MSKNLYGVIGAGSFGTALANILAENGNVLLLTRKQHVYDSMVQTRYNRHQHLHERVCPTLDMEALCAGCTVIFPVVPAADFRITMQLAAPYLKPYHLLIHGTKGLSVNKPLLAHSSNYNEHHTAIDGNLSLADIRTMSQIIQEETSVLRIGCLSGPNLAHNLAARQPAATSIASRFQEVIEQGKKALRTPLFRVYGNSNVLGIELAGAFSKMTAIASGIVGGMHWGENTTAMLLTRSLHEIIRLGKKLGIEHTAFLGLGGIGDMAAIAFSPRSRNYTVGYRLAQGEPLAVVLQSMHEVAEGIHTVAIAKHLANYYRVHTPIIDALFNVLFKCETIESNMARLMEEDLDKDTEF